jgi:pyrroloquinoline quinone biosynthesis protein B
MVARAIGTAAGGAFPQWNCCCDLCEAARASPQQAESRTHASLAISADRDAWFIVNATPDIRMQIEATPALQPRGERRGTPIRAVLLSDAELDHTLGLLQLREGSALTVHAGGAVLGALEHAMPVRGVLEPYAPIDWRGLDPGVPLELDGGLTVEALALEGKPPRYVPPGAVELDWVFAFRFRDRETGAMMVYAPAVERWTEALEDFMTGAGCVFFDGTFWAEDDLPEAAGRPLSAAETGHLPISGEHGSAARLSSLRAERKVYVHINNTNPILHARSPERMELAALGLEIGHDGIEWRSDE